VPHPVLVLAGRHDRRCTVGAAQDMARRLPNDELAVFEQSAHMMVAEEQDRYPARARRFLGRLTPRRRRGSPLARLGSRAAADPGAGRPATTPAHEGSQHHRTPITSAPRSASYARCTVVPPRPSRRAEHFLQDWFERRFQPWICTRLSSGDPQQPSRRLVVSCRWPRSWPCAELTALSACLAAELPGRGWREDAVNRRPGASVTR